MRHLIIKDKNFSFRNRDQFDEFAINEKLSLKNIMADDEAKEIYLNILALILDN